VHDLFVREYMDRQDRLKLEQFRTTERDSDVTCEARIVWQGEARSLTARGNGPIDAFVRALTAAGLPAFELVSYTEHSLGRGADTLAASYIQIKTPQGRVLFGAGMDTNIELASIKALV